MAYEKKDGDTIIFKNNTENEKAPSHKGEVLIKGVTYEIALWTKNGPKGEFWAGTTKIKGERTDRPVADNSRNLNDDMEDFIPF